MCRQWESLERSALIKQTPSPKARASSWKESELWSQSWWSTPRKQCLPDTTGLITQTNLQRLGQHAQDLHRLHPDTIPGLRKEADIKSHPSPRSCLQLIATGREKFSFPQWRFIGCFKHTPRQASCSRSGSPHKPGPMLCFNSCVYALRVGGRVGGVDFSFYF